MKKTTLCVLLLPVLASHALTIREPDRYYTDFQDASVANDFRFTRILSYADESSASVGFSFVNGSLRLFQQYNRQTGVALVSGGTEWLPNTDVIVGLDYTSSPRTNLWGRAHGVFTNTITTVEYTLNNAGKPSFNLHSNVMVMVFVRKVNTPYDYRHQSYFALYNGVRFSINEYTCSTASTFRELAGQNVALAANGSRLKIRVAALGGSDGTLTGQHSTYKQTGESPAMLEAWFWVDGALAANVKGKDIPLDWANGPEYVSNPATFVPANDSNNGEWVFANRDENADWRSRDGRAPWQHINNRDIADRGWTGIVYRDTLNNGSPPDLFVHKFEVVKSLHQPTLLFLK